MRVVQLMASPFYGGPERQVIGLAQHLPGDIQSVFLSFHEHGGARTFLDEVRRQGFEGKVLSQNTPRLIASIREIADELRHLKADLVCCNGYKPDIIGWRAARRAGVPVIAISHGWTAATWKVRRYEALDRLVMRWMDAVVCVSEAQADKVRLGKVPEAKIAVIRNAIGEDAFIEAKPECRAEMSSWFAQPPRWIIGAAGRLSPEKGYGVFIDAAAQVARQRPDAGFVLFGEGSLRAELEQSILKHRLQGKFVLAGFRNDVRSYFPSFDLFVMSSFREGLPVVLLETGAAGVASVATAVGGIPEVIEEGYTGNLVPAGNSQALAQGIVALLDDESLRLSMGRAARSQMRQDFTFAAMGQRYHALFLKVMQQTGNRQAAGIQDEYRP